MIRLNLVFIFGTFLVLVKSTTANVPIAVRYGEEECESLIPLNLKCLQFKQHAKRVCQGASDVLAKKCDKAFHQLTDGCNQKESGLLNNCQKSREVCQNRLHFLDIVCNKACDAIKDFCRRRYIRIGAKCDFIFERLHDRCNGINEQYHETCELSLDPYNWRQVERKYFEAKYNY